MSTNVRHHHLISFGGRLYLTNQYTGIHDDEADYDHIIAVIYTYSDFFDEHSPPILNDVDNLYKLPITLPNICLALSKPLTRCIGENAIPSLFLKMLK